MRNVEENRPVVKKKKKYMEEAFIAVTVATLWREPGVHRELDRPALGNPVDLRGWLAAMDVEDKRGLVGKVETQALLGQRVLVLEEKGDWVRVAVPDQANPEEPRGYPGWLPVWQLAFDPTYEAALAAGRDAAREGEKAAGPGGGGGGSGAGGGIAAVRTLTTWLHHAPDADARFLEISFETRLPVVAVEGDWVAVAVPAAGPAAAAAGSRVNGSSARRDPGVKWLRRAHVTLLGREGPGDPRGGELLATARRFLGVPYLWGGTSGFGVDCSGFVYLVHRAHGVLIPRDAGPQRDFGHGRPVERDRLEPGDLLFFAHDGGRGAVHHVTMYAGDGRMIHAPNSERSVEVIPLETPPYGEKYAGARRYHGGAPPLAGGTGLGSGEG